MIIPAVCFIAGLAAMGRTKPKTTVRKLMCLGPRTGLVYPVEDFHEIGTVIVRAPNGSAIVQFIRACVRQPGAVGLVYQHGQGDPRVIELIQRDFGVEPQKPAAVPTPAPSAAPKDAASRSAP